MLWWRSKGKKSRQEKELDSELRFHLDQLINDKIASGLPAEEARREALLEFGGREQVKEECRDVHRVASVENTILNLKSAMRFIRKSPGFTIAVVLTLALGIGANSAVFSAIDAVILRPLPYPQSDRLMVIHQYKSKGKTATNVSTQRLEDWNRLSGTFGAITGYYTEDTSETSGALPERLEMALVARRFLPVLGVTPILGRDFSPAEERFGGPAAALISYRLWQRRFHSDPEVIGKKLRMGKYVSPIIGVMPANFAFPDKTTDVWEVSPPDAPVAQDREQTWFSVIGRLKTGVSLAQARADLAIAQAQLARQYPKSDKEISVGVEPLKDSVIGQSGTSLWLLFGAVSVLLLIACTNVAALLLARTSERSREIAIRYSLGASRASVIVQLLTESVVLALLGSIAGLGLAGAAMAVLRSLAKMLPRVDEIALDWRTLLYALSCAFLCTLLFGLAPAVQATRRTVADSLAHGGRTQVAGHTPLQWLLVGVQVALAVALLLGAALLLRSFQALGHVSPGFESAHILTLRLSGDWSETADMRALAARVDHDLDAIRNTPGVVAAATSVTLPGVPNDYPGEYRLEGYSGQLKVIADQKAVSDGYFETMRIPILSGESCRREPTFRSVVVNRTFVATFLGDQLPLGRHVQLLHDPFQFGTKEIVGVVADAHENGIHEAPMPTLYACISA